jgi:hypothetical protein
MMILMSPQWLRRKRARMILMIANRVGFMRGDNEWIGALGVLFLSCTVGWLCEWDGMSRALLQCI